MAEERTSGLKESLQAGASMAHAVKGAVKAGKAVSGAAKGVAVGADAAGSDTCHAAQPDIWRCGKFPFTGRP